jgi:hypothetical protein
MITPSKINISARESDMVYGVGGNLPPVNLPSGDWTPYIPSFEPQRFIYDTDECSQLGGVINPLEMYFNWLKATNQIPPAFMAFLIANKYFDTNGSFSFSERFTAILDGTSINGNTPQNGWRCVQKYWLIPRSMLNWTVDDGAQYPNQALMDTSYYNPAVITQEMIDLGQKFGSFIKNLGWGWYGGVGTGTTEIPIQSLQTGLQTSPLALAVSVPQPVSDWNQQLVPYTGGIELEHVVSLYKIDQTNPYPYFFTDQYEPFQKQFQVDYFLSVAIAFFVVLSD